MACQHRAVLIITRDVKGTSSNLAAGRTELTCSKPEGHDGFHEDEALGEKWKDRGDVVTHILRAEGEDAD
jgi:hypothetical protein